MATPEKPCREIRFTIAPFSGDPQLLEFFIEQVQFKLNSAKYTKEQALTFIKSKLSDDALKFYISSPACKNAKSPDDLFEIFRRFFKTESDTKIAQQFNHITFDQNENINIFANRLENIIRKRFPDMTEDSIQQILVARFNDLIPTSYKVHLLTQNVTDFSAMVSALDKFQELTNDSLNPSLPGTSFASIQNVTHQNHKINELSSSDSNSQDAILANISHGSHVNQVQQHDRPQIQCQWCMKGGHSAQNCFTLKRARRNRVHDQFRSQHSRSIPGTPHQSRTPNKFKSKYPPKSFQSPKKKG